MKRVLFFIFLISFFTTKSQTIISDTVLDINCYHEGAIYTKVASLDSNVYTKWHYSQDTSFWNFLDTASFGVYLNNSNLTSDTLTITGTGGTTVTNTPGSDTITIDTPAGASKGFATAMAIAL